MKVQLKTIAYISILIAVLLAIWFILFGDYVLGNTLKPDIEKIKLIHPFVSGIVVPLLTFGTTLLIVETFRNNNLQNISNNVFKLIDQNRKILEGVNCDTTHLTGDYIKSKGKDFFDDLAERIANDYNAIISNDQEYISKIDSDLQDLALSKTDKELLVEIYNFYYHIHQSDLGHFFRNLFYIVKYVDSSSIRKVDKIELIRILRSQLSNYELLLLAYNGLNDYGKEFYKYIEQYELLKSVNHETKVPMTYGRRIVNPKIIIKNYPHLEKYWILD